MFPLKIHITGAYGLIGNLVFKHLSQWPDRYELFGSGRRTMSSQRADSDARMTIPFLHHLIIQDYLFQVTYDRNP